MALIHDLPPSIRIGPYDCRVIVGQTEKDIWGAWTGREAKLDFADDFPTASLALDTVLHEVGHAIYQVMHLKSGDREERVVGAMATGWAQVLRDNPGLLAWLARAANAP